MTGLPPGAIIGDTTETEAAAILMHPPQKPWRITDDGKPYLVTSKTHDLHDVERFLPAPVMIERKDTLADIDSFKRYILRFGGEQSIVYADLQEDRMMALIDAPAPGQPRWGRHKALFALRKSPQWDVWMGSNRQKMKQGDFAEFIENNVPDIINPRGADLLEMCRDLDVKRGIAVTSAERIQGGTVEVTYQETDVIKVGKRKIEIPENIEIKIPIWWGSRDQVVLQARLRYRLDGPMFTLFYDLYRPEDALELGWKAMTDAIAFDTKAIVYQAKDPTQAR